ncbi:MAG: cytochrome b [Methylophilaceae bacterium]|nr:cytochrome b [Methylophilaceae bacterium]MDG1821357.1 cytochrome b [Methylophilaceae bacterium]
MSIVLHWMMAILIVAVYACIEFREFYPKGSEPREALKMWHFMLGLSVFILVWVRLFFMMQGHRPLIEPTPLVWQQSLAKAAHVALYGLMIVLPLLGWLMLSAKGKTIPFFGLSLPALMAKNKELGSLIKEIHETGGTLGYYLIELHTFAGLFHHYVMRDNTLMRMLPCVRKK